MFVPVNHHGRSRFITQTNFDVSYGWEVCELHISRAIQQTDKCGKVQGTKGSRSRGAAAILLLRDCRIEGESYRVPSDEDGFWIHEETSPSPATTTSQPAETSRATASTPTTTTEATTGCNQEVVCDSGGGYIWSEGHRDPVTRRKFVAISCWIFKRNSGLNIYGKTIVYEEASWKWWISTSTFSLSQAPIHEL